MERGMKKSDIEAIAGAVANTMKAYVDARLQEFAAKALTYRGTYQHGEQYQKGNFVTHAGSMWHAQVDAPTDKPGSNTGHWKLAVKRGKDADTRLLAELRDSVTGLLLRGDADRG